MNRSPADQIISRRPADDVMRLTRLGSLHQSRLSFMRLLTRRMAQENWTFSCARFDIDDHGVGHAVYHVETGRRAYSLVAFSHDLPPEKRTDRVIAEAWDATFVLFDGKPTEDDICRLSQNVPKQEAGRIDASELALSRANRSVRLWDHVVQALANGEQPDHDRIVEVGYLMRTTAVYGSGKFGAADRDLIAHRPEMSVPFQAEMLCVYLIRCFVRDLVNHMARMVGGDRAARLSPETAQALGIGNSTGLGMAPFIVNHPILFNNWIMAREEAIARTRALRHVHTHEWDEVRHWLKAVAAQVGASNVTHDIQTKRNAALLQDLAALEKRMAEGPTDEHPWDGLAIWASSALSEEGQECLNSAMLEPYGHLIDGLEHCLPDTLDQTFRIDGAIPVARMKDLIERGFGWALELDWTNPENTARAWYVSEEKLEPRLGERYEEDIAAYEQPLAIARDATLCHRDMSNWPDEVLVAHFLLRHPEHRMAIRRAQISAFAPYSEIRDNLIGAEMLPIDMLRAKLSFFGATEFDPRSDRWVRIRMFAGAPYPEDLTPDTADHWVYRMSGP